jgi:hypothetical protein
MNIYVIIIAIFLLVLMTIFGHNPVDEARKRRAKEGSKDPLVHAIEQYNKEKHYGYSGHGSSGGPGQILNPSAPGGVNNLPGAGGQSRSYSPSPAQVGQPPAQPNPYQQNNNDSYYPPAPPGVQPSPLQQQQQQQQQLPVE